MILPSLSIIYAFIHKSFAYSFRGRVKTVVTFDPDGTLGIENYSLGGLNGL